MDPSPLLDGVAAPDAAVGKSQISRHRRIHKEVGAITGITFVDHPKGSGVVVTALNANGACAKSGVRIGDHITKINGERPTDTKHAVALCDKAWTAQADGTDKNKDRLKFSLHYRTQDFAIGRALPSDNAAPSAIEQFEGIQPVASVSVESLGGQRRGLLGSSGKKVEDSGLGLEDSPHGYGALISTVVPDSPAHVAGLEPGLTVVSVDGTLCPSGHGAVAKMIDAARAKKGAAHIVCHLKKEKDDHDHI